MAKDVSPKIRRATFEDVSALVALYRAFFAEDGISTKPEQISENLSLMLADPRAAVFVFEEEEAPVGLAAVSTTYGVEFGCAAEFEDLFVVPSSRGRGISTQLVRAVIGWAKAQSVSEVALVITQKAEQEQGLTAFYEKFGFRDADRITMYRKISRDT